MAAILEVYNLVKKFGTFTAVDDISFDIQEGEIFSLLGPNGAGKTTTISIISSLIPPTGGDALVSGRSVIRESMEVRKLIGVVPQEIALYDTLTARENLLFWGRMYGMGGAKLSRRVDEVFAQIGLTEKANARVKTFSGGMKRRVNIGVGLLHNPRLLFMDEPTVGIDPQSRRNILDAVKDMKQAGMTVLYTTHYMEEAQELSDRVGIIDHGQLIALGTQKELTQMVGQHETLRLHIDESQDAEELAKAFHDMPGILQSSAAAHTIVLNVTEAEDALAPVITRANELNFNVRTVEIQEPNLETVFLHLTGRALRE